LTPLPLFLKIKNKLKHLGDDKVYAFAVANLCQHGKFHLFYDVDEFNSNLFLCGDGFMSFKTKHGVQIVYTVCEELNEVYERFLRFKNRFNSDYFWSVPLWLRISVKFNERGVVSPAPMPCCCRHYDWFKYHFRNKKLYQTWD